MENRNAGMLSFLTWNLYNGADLTPAVIAVPAQLPERVTKVFRQFLATNCLARVKEIANQIAAQEPDIIGLQEAVAWQLVIPEIRLVTYDFVQLLLAELAQVGLDYKIAAVNRNSSAELPDSNGNLVRLLDRDVILVRNRHEIKIVNRQEATYKASLTLKVAGQLVEILRGWSLVDFKCYGRVFRLINTHLEADDSVVQVNQAKELLAGPADTDLPLIITGDLNSNADGSGTPTYRLFINAGFHDAWEAAGRGMGFTCCQDADLLNAVSGLTSRIDYILFKNGWQPEAAELVGENQESRTWSGLWPSDHAGLAAGLFLTDCW